MNALRGKFLHGIQSIAVCAVYLLLLCSALKAEPPAMVLDVSKGFDCKLSFNVVERSMSQEEFFYYLKGEIMRFRAFPLEIMINKSVSLGDIIDIDIELKKLKIKDLKIFIVLGFTETEDGRGQILLRPLDVGEIVSRAILSYRPPAVNLIDGQTIHQKMPEIPRLPVK